MNQFATFLPALVFFIVFFGSGKDFILATLALMIVMTGQVIYEKFSRGKVNTKFFYAWVVYKFSLHSLILPFWLPENITPVVRFVNMTGATNGWAVEAITYNQGNGTQAGTIGFS